MTQHTQVLTAVSRRLCSMLSITALVPVLWSCLALVSAAAFAQPGSTSGQDSDYNPPDPVHDNQGNTDRKIVHRRSPDINLQNPFGIKPLVSTKAPSTGSSGSIAPAISYHGGPVMSSLSKVVLIWYGNWNQSNGTDTPSGQQIIRDALYGLSLNYNTNNYSGITTGYQSNLGRYTQKTPGLPVSQASSSTLVEATVAASSTYGGTTLSDASVLSLVKNYGGAADSNAIYFVLSSSDISESSGFLSKYCGWHTYATMGSSKIKYGFVGNPSKQLSACSVQSISPNGNPGVDAMTSVLAHELVETVTDPLLNAWYNSNGAENSDMCAWTFGSRLLQSSNGAYYNVQLPTSTGTRNYLLQRQLSASTSKCYIDANGPVQ